MAENRKIYEGTFDDSSNNSHIVVKLAERYKFVVPDYGRFSIGEFKVRKEDVVNYISRSSIKLPQTVLYNIMARKISKKVANGSLEKKVSEDELDVIGILDEDEPDSP